MSGLDWPGLMRAGLFGLGLRPEEFWHLTPAELFLMLGAGEARPRLDRTRLEDLIRQFPDSTKGNDDGGDRPHR